MKLPGRKIFLIMLLLAFGFLCGVSAEEPGASTDEFSTPQKAFFAMQSAIQNEDYDEVWQMSAESLKQRFNADFEEFKKSFSDPALRTGILSSKVDSVNFLTPEAAEIRTLVSFSVSNSMVLEDGVWKFAGKIEENR